MKYLTKDLANTIGVSTNTIRRYEEYGFLKPDKGENNYRAFDYFDAIRAAQIRLYGKCSFSNEEILQMLRQPLENISSVYQNKIDSIDAQIEQLTNYKNWLTENKLLVKFALENSDNYIIRKCTPFRYICFRNEFEQLDDPARNKAIKAFTYNTPGLYIVNIGKRSSSSPKPISQYTAWAVAEHNIDNFGLRDLVNNCPYIEEYPERECIFTVQNIPANISNDIPAVINHLIPTWNKTLAYLTNKGYVPDGDIAQLYLNVISDTITIVECLPIKLATKLGTGQNCK